MTARPVVKQWRYRVYGVVLVAVAALFVVTSIGFYEKAFTPVVSVQLRTDSIGNQLRTGADVKVRGMIVGDVRAIRATSDGAVLDLALEPDSTAEIPRNVSARLLPKTLFGERYVSLHVPDDPAEEPVSAGSVISQDRSESAIELQRVLDNLLPVLRSVRPDKLATTLHAMSSALRGRGEQLGENLVQLNAYLERVIPSLPDMRAVFEDITPVADTYAAAAPDVLTALRDLTATTRTVVDKRAELRTMFGNLTTAAGNLDRFLAANRDNLIRLNATAKPTLRVLEKYSPEYPCLLKEIVRQIPVAERAFGKGTKHPEVGKVTLEITSSRGKYKPGVDEPRNLDKRGPRCYPRPVPPERFPQYPAGGPIKDGASHPPAGETDNPDKFAPTVPQSASPTTSDGVANSGAERDLIATLLAPRLRVPPDEVPVWSGLLVGPLYRGMEVQLR